MGRNRHGKRRNLRAECRLALIVGVLLLVMLVAGTGPARHG
jgi:hypothetical protein